MSDIAKSVLAQYEKNKATSGSRGKFSSQEDRMKKYFTTIIPKGKQNDERRIRILPTKDGSTPFVEVKFHELQVDGNWMKLYDPAQEGKRSPLNEVYDALMETGIEEDKILARSYRSRKFYVVKVIDRDHEEDGVKFWRFKHNSKGEGVMDKIFPIFKNKGDITDVETGRDLILSLSLTKANNGKEYTVISSIIPDDVSPLHSDPEKIKEWVDDDLVWGDVYSKKNEDYLDMVANGETPKWDFDQNKWVSRDSVGEATIEGKAKDDNTNTDSGTTNVENVEVVDPQADETPADDLPF